VDAAHKASAIMTDARLKAAAASAPVMTPSDNARPGSSSVAPASIENAAQGLGGHP
jgi:hypothetical protein